MGSKCVDSYLCTLWNYKLQPMQSLPQSGIWYVLWTHCPSPKVICWNPTPQYNCIWREDLLEMIKVKWGYKGGTLVNRISIFTSKLFLHVHTHSPEWEGGCLQAKKKSPQNETYFTNALIVDAPASQTGRNKLIWFESPCLCYFVW